MSTDGAADLPVSPLRASDADREAMTERLRVACADGRITIDELHQRVDQAYAARTSSELAVLAADLPEGTGPGSAGSWAGPPPPTAAPILALFGGTERRGRWRLARRERVVALCGGVKLDLTEADWPVDGLSINAFAACGGIDIVVPAGVQVELTGMAIFGGRDVKVAKSPAAGAPALVLRLHAVAICGGVVAETEKPRQLDR